MTFTSEELRNAVPIWRLPGGRKLAREVWSGNQDAKFELVQLAQDYSRKHKQRSENYHARSSNNEHLDRSREPLKADLRPRYPMPSQQRDHSHSHSRREHRDHSRSRRGHRDDSGSRGRHRDHSRSRQKHRNHSHSRRGHRDHSRSRRPTHQHGDRNNFPSQPQISPAAQQMPKRFTRTARAETGELLKKGGPVMRNAISHSGPALMTNAISEKDVLLKGVRKPTLSPTDPSKIHVIDAPISKGIFDVQPPQAAEKQPQEAKTQPQRAKKQQDPTSSGKVQRIIIQKPKEAEPSPVIEIPELPLEGADI